MTLPELLPALHGFERVEKLRAIQVLTRPPQRFGYVEADPLLGSASALPYAPITLELGGREIQVLPFATFLRDFAAG